MSTSSWLMENRLSGPNALLTSALLTRTENAREIGIRPRQDLAGDRRIANFDVGDGGRATRHARLLRRHGDVARAIVQLVLSRGRVADHLVPPACKAEDLW